MDVNNNDHNDIENTITSECVKSDDSSFENNDQKWCSLTWYSSIGET